MPTKTPAKPKKTTPAKPAAAPEPPAAPQEPETPTTELAPVENSIQRMLKGASETALSLPPETTYDEWCQIFTFLEQQKNRGLWWIGDVIEFAEKSKFKDRYVQMIDMTGIGYSRLTTISSVCSRIEPKRRRTELKFSWHEQIAYLPYQTGDHLLDRAIKEKWSWEQFCDSVARAKGEPTKAEKRAAKEAAKGGGAKTLPNSANPPTLDGHLTLELQQPEKALMWNGYALTTKNREVYQGPDKLTTEEADRAAHHHGHAHAAALMNWLEEHNFRKEGDEPCATNSATQTSDSKDTLTPSSENTEASVPSTSTSKPNTVASNGASVVQPDAAPKIAQPAAPAAPPTPSESPALSMPPNPEEGAPCVICNQPITPYDAYGVGAGIGHRYHWGCVRKEAATVGDGQPPAGQTATSVPIATKSSLELAEHHILAFNAASAEVNEEEWKTIGENKLLRTKWLNRLLAQADIVIDKIQGHTPAPRK